MTLSSNRPEHERAQGVAPPQHMAVVALEIPLGLPPCGSFSLTVPADSQVLCGQFDQAGMPWLTFLVPMNQPPPAVSRRFRLVQRNCELHGAWRFVGPIGRDGLIFEEL